MHPGRRERCDPPASAACQASSLYLQDCRLAGRLAWATRRWRLHLAGQLQQAVIQWTSSMAIAQQRCWSGQGIRAWQVFVSSCPALESFVVMSDGWDAPLAHVHVLGCSLALQSIAGTAAAAARMDSVDAHRLL